MQGEIRSIHMKPIHSHNGNLPTEERGLEILLGLFPSSLFQLLKKKVQQYLRGTLATAPKSQLFGFCRSP